MYWPVKADYYKNMFSFLSTSDYQQPKEKQCIMGNQVLATAKVQYQVCLFVFYYGKRTKKLS